MCTFELSSILLQSTLFKRLNISSDSAVSDELLLERFVRSGDTAALGTLYGRYMPMVYGVCLKWLQDSGKAEDAVMSIYEELVRKLPQQQVESFRGWLFVVARNYCLMELRKQQRRPTDLYAPEDMQRYDDGGTESPDAELPPDHSKPLEKCMGELPDAQRKSVQWFYYEDKSYKDIADLMQEEVGKVRSFIQNGRRNLKICLEKAGVQLDNPL